MTQRVYCTVPALLVLPLFSGDHFIQSTGQTEAIIRPPIPNTSCKDQRWHDVIHSLILSQIKARVCIGIGHSAPLQWIVFPYSSSNKGLFIYVFWQLQAFLLQIMECVFSTIPSFGQKEPVLSSHSGATRVSGRERNVNSNLWWLLEEVYISSLLKQQKKEAWLYVTAAIKQDVQSLEISSSYQLTEFFPGGNPYLTISSS